LTAMPAAKAIGASVAKAVKDALAGERRKRKPDPGPPIFISADVRHTKSLGGFEFDGFGFGLAIPTASEPGDDIESKTTRGRLRPKYEAVVEFLAGMLGEVNKSIDAAIGSARGGRGGSGQ